MDVRAEAARLLADQVQAWREEANLGSTYERGKGRDEAMLHCADELEALGVRLKAILEQEP